MKVTFCSLTWHFLRTSFIVVVAIYHIITCVCVSCYVYHSIHSLLTHGSVGLIPHRPSESYLQLCSNFTPAFVTLRYFVKLYLTSETGQQPKNAMLSFLAPVRASVGGADKYSNFAL